MDPTKTRIIGGHRLGDPVLVPGIVAFGVILVVLALGGAVGWLAGRGASAAPPAPVIVDRRCVSPEPVRLPDPPLAMPATATARAAGTVSASRSKRPTRLRVAQFTHTAGVPGTAWEPAPL
jgi:hypothetical protein